MEFEAHLSTYPFFQDHKNPEVVKDIGGAYSRWSGKGKDDYGRFIVKDAINFGMHGEKNEEVYGADIGVSFSRIKDWKSKSIDEFIKSEPATSVAIGALEIINGDGKFGLGFGFGGGFGSSKINTIASKLLAYTKEDVQDVPGVIIGYKINEEGKVVFAIKHNDSVRAFATEIEPVEQSNGHFYTNSYLQNKEESEK